MNNQPIQEEEKDINIVITCPHCLNYVIIEKLQCGIFRHGVLIKTGKQIDPHANKELCDYYIKNNKIYGCGKPYQVIKEGEEYKAIICEYI
jgi:hypothetical protein